MGNPLKSYEFFLTPELVDIESSQFTSYLKIVIILTLFNITPVFSEVDDISSGSYCYFETCFPGYVFLFSDVLTSAGVSHALIVNLLK